MEKYYEKKNFGIPVIILNILAYLIGYSLTRSLSGTLLIAVLLVGVVFSFQFDNKVKNAIIHSYIIATYFILIGFAFDILESFIGIFSNGRLASMNTFGDISYGLGIVPRVLTFLYTYSMIIVDIAAVVVFGLFVLMTLLGKEINLSFVKKIFKERQPKKNNPAPVQQAPYQQPVNQQPVTPPAAQATVQQPVTPPAAQAPVQQPVTPPPTPVRLAPGVCANCGNANGSDSKFCASCGSKLN